MFCAFSVLNRCGGRVGSSSSGVVSVEREWAIAILCCRKENEWVGRFGDVVRVDARGTYTQEPRKMKILLRHLLPLSLYAVDNC